MNATEVRETHGDPDSSWRTLGEESQSDLTEQQGMDSHELSLLAPQKYNVLIYIIPLSSLLLLLSYPCPN